MSRAKHGCDFEIIERNADNTKQTWLASCACGSKWTGATYVEAEDKWRAHYHAQTAETVRPMGDTSVPRWTPEGGAS